MPSDDLFISQHVNISVASFPIESPPLRTFVEDNRAALQDKRLAAFFCCSGGPGKVLEKFRAFLVPGCSQQEIILIDPKDKPSSENENKIVAFCDAMR